MRLDFLNGNTYLFLDFPLVVSMKKKLIHLILGLIVSAGSYAQSCTPLGDQTTYGTNDTWIGYVYDNANFTNYAGFITVGTAGNPNFNDNFGGDNVTYPTNGCSFLTSTFSVRYRLRKTFAAGNYDFVVGGDDGFRLSLDGGATWVVNRWNDQAYTQAFYSATLNGTYDIVLEYYENGGQNRISFELQSACGTTGNPAVYGTGNIWRGYIYDGTGFNTYRGFVTRGTASNPNFDENFGGSNVGYGTSDCTVQTETFSARFRLQQSFVNQVAVITVGGDDGYRFSIDGGATWLINRWFDQSYNVSTVVVTLNGTYNFVLEFYENGGGNRVSFNFSTSVLSGRFGDMSASPAGDKVALRWTTLQEKNVDHFTIEAASDNVNFQPIGQQPSKAIDGNSDLPLSYSFFSPTRPGHTLYRIIMRDKDGRTTISPQLSFRSGGGKREYRFFPTLIRNGRITLQTTDQAESLTLKIFSATGQLLGERKLQTRGGGEVVQVELPAPTRPHGVYRLQLTTPQGRIHTQTVVAE